MTALVLIVSELRCICAWCGDVIREGHPGAKVTHGICQKCEAKVLGEIES